MEIDIITGEAPYGFVVGPVGTEVRLLVEVAKNVIEVGTLHIFDKKLTSASDFLKGHV